MSKATEKLKKMLAYKDGSLGGDLIKNHEARAKEAVIGGKDDDEGIKVENSNENDEDGDDQSDPKKTETAGEDRSDEDGNGDKDTEAAEEEEKSEQDEEPKDNFLDQLLLMSHQDMWVEISLTWEQFIWVRKVFQHLPSAIVFRVAHKKRLGPPPGPSLCATNSKPSARSHLSASYPIKTTSSDEVCGNFSLL